MARLERLLEYLDQPGVSEIVIGVDRPIAIRVDGAFRAVSPQPFAREHIVDLLDGTSLSGLIDSPESLPGLEVNACARWLVVEVVRRGAEAALRISLPISQSAPPPRGSTIDPPTTRFKTPVSGVPTTSTRTPATGVPITNSTRTPASGVPITGSRTPASGVPITSSRTPASGVPVTSSRTPASGVPVTSASAVGTARSPTSAPAAGGPARGTTTPPVGVPATPPSNTSYPVSTTNVPRGFDATDIPTSRIPLTKSGETGTLPIPMTGDVPAELLISEPGEIEVLLLTDTWTGPRILDERANVAALVPLIRAARNAGATDLHLAAGRAIMIRRVGELTNLDVANLPAGVSPGLRAALSGPLSAGTAKGLLWPLLGPSGQKQLMNVGYVDLAVEVPGAGRVRINVSRQQEGLCGTFRLIIQHTPTLDTLGLPRELSKVISHHQGLVVIAGPNGHGKTSTMAALVDQLNATKKHHIITIEEPVEVEHEPKLAIVSHRE
ncbi:MAG TPA: ATPase, T2SS/T4P/T4SS family, partial [Kofleriaceae bacterium]